IVAQVLPCVVPDPSRVHLPADQRRDQLFESGDHHPAADPGRVAEPGADQTGIRGDVSEDDLDVGDLVNLGPPRAFGERDPRELEADGIDLHGGVSLSGGWCVAQPLTEPAARPATRRFWTIRNPTITGRTERTPPAVSRSQRIWYSPMNRCSPMGRVRVEVDEVKVSA